MMDVIREIILENALSAIDIYCKERHSNYGRENVWRTPIEYTVLNYDFTREGTIRFRIMVHPNGKPTDHDPIVGAVYNIESDTLGVY